MQNQSSETSDLRRLAEELTQEALQFPERPGSPCPVDARVENFLNGYFADLTADEPLRLPRNQIPLTRAGIADVLAIPEDEATFANEYLTSYRVRNGVLHNPRSDRRTTEGTFHVVEGGLPIPGDKKAVPKQAFVGLFRAALKLPAELALVPFTALHAEVVRGFVSLLLRPTVCPKVPGVCANQSMEVRFFAPGSLVSNLDFVERIFGNAGDPWDPANDAGLDVEHWTGHSGCVILAPHLTRMTKKELGLPHWDEASERQRRDGMCWRTPDERYNEGQAFKVTCRSMTGVIVTLIADNYFGYCKKEVKTQISYVANLSGNVEEEHAGGTLAFPSYSLGYEFDATRYAQNDRKFEDVVHDYADSIDVRPAGYAIDRTFPNLIYIPHDAQAGVTRQAIWWTREGRERSIPLLPEKVYMTPSGYQLRLEKHPVAQSWRLIGTVPEGIFCHKPCTVSGGGKSEISKSLLDYMVYGPIFVADVEKDFEFVQAIFDRDYSDRWKPGRAPDYSARPSRPVLSPERSVGSVIKLLTPSEDYTDEYNEWLTSFPSYIYPIVFIIKRFVQPQGSIVSPVEEAVVRLEGSGPAAGRGLTHWRDHFGVDSVNGFPGHELKAFGRKLVGTYLRVGLLGSQGWRTFKVRQDFAASTKVQTEDDITASVVIPGRILRGALQNESSYKFAVNCEFRLFQRPDDAIHRGLDKQTETDLARSDNFLSNFEPLTAAQARTMMEQVVEFDDFTPPMKELLQSAAAGSDYVVSSANPRLVDGDPSKNPRYLQQRPDLMNPISRYVAERGARLARELPPEEPLYQPVDAVLIGRRNNPPDPEAGIRPLAVYSPIHYQELPELFMDFICSLTGKSPSTTGAGSEGALTKGPFNALRPIADLNTALVSYALTGLAGFSTAAGYVGPRMRVDHDISLLIPEIWCRLSAEERNPKFLIEEGHLERLKDFEHDGRPVLASRLGYRITMKFVRTFFGRVFDNPGRVFEESLLQPETQDLDAFVDGVHNITEAQQRVARQYFEDGSVEDACPPLKVLLAIMVEGHHEGRDEHHPDVRAMFTPEAILGSDWYHERLIARQARDNRFWTERLEYLSRWLDDNPQARRPLRAEIQRRRELVDERLSKVRAPAYLESLEGMLGLDPSLSRP